MRNKRKNKYMLLLILLLGITLGYAAISTTLKITGQATVTKQSWDVYWGVPTVTEGSVTTTAPTRTADSGDPANTKLTWDITLDLPGDYYEFTVDAVNNGTIDAMITGIEQTVTPALPEYIKYTVTYADGGEPEENHLLAKKDGNTPTTVKYNVRVYYDENLATRETINNMTADTAYTFNLGLTYGQANENAIALTCPGSSCVYAFPYFPGTTVTDDEETEITTYTYDENQWWISDGTHILRDSLYDGVLETGTHQRTTLQSTDYTENYEDVIQESGKNYFLGMILNKNKQINKAFMCYKKNDEVTCIEIKTQPVAYDSMQIIQQIIFDDPATYLRITKIVPPENGRIMETRIRDADKTCFISRTYSYNGLIGCFASDFYY